MEEGHVEEQGENISSNFRGSSAEGVFRAFPLLDAVVLESNRHDRIYIILQIPLCAPSKKSRKLNLCVSSRSIWVLRGRLASLKPNEF